MISTETLIQAVQSVINDYEASYQDDTVSTQAIADKCLSAYTTINELKKGKLKHLSVKKALEISSRLNGPRDLSELIKSVAKDKATEAAKFTKEFSHLFPYELEPGNYERFMADKEFARIVWAAFGSNHITRSEIQRRWGQEGEDRLNILINAGLLLESEGEIKGVSGSCGFGMESTYKQLGLGYEMYSPANREKQENWLSFQTESVTPQFIKEFREKLQEVFLEFHEKSNSYTAQGKQRMFFGMIFDRYMGDLPDKRDLQ